MGEKIERLRFPSQFSDRSTQISSRHYKNEKEDTAYNPLISAFRIKRRISRKPDEALHFSPYSISMRQPTTASESQTILQSAKMVLRSVKDELISYKLALKHQRTKSPLIIGLATELHKNIGKDFNQIEPYLGLLLNKSKQSLTLGLLFLFACNIILEVYGRRKQAMENWLGMLERQNKEGSDIFLNAKIMIYYRLGMCYLRQRNYKTALVYGKKLLKFSWYFNNEEYELKAYRILWKACYYEGNHEIALIMQQRCNEDYIEPRNHVRELGIKQVVAAFKVRKRNRSSSHDEFDLELLQGKVNQVNNLKGMKLVGGKRVFKSQSQDCTICALYVKNQKIQLKDYFPYKKGVPLLTENSAFRNFETLYESDQIQEIYKPKQTIPVIKQLLYKFIELV